MLACCFKRKSIFLRRNQKIKSEEKYIIISKLYGLIISKKLKLKNFIKNEKVSIKFSRIYLDYGNCTKDGGQSNY